MKIVQLIAAAAISVATLSAGRAEAADMPRYNVKAHCNEIANVGGSYSAMIMKSCFQQEQSAYDQLKPHWADLPAPMRTHCDEIATVGSPGSYVILQSCIKMELDSANEIQGQEFKY